MRLHPRTGAAAMDATIAPRAAGNAASAATALKLRRWELPAAPGLAAAAPASARPARGGVKDRGKALQLCKSGRPFVAGASFEPHAERRPSPRRPSGGAFAADAAAGSKPMTADSQKPTTASSCMAQEAMDMVLSGKASLPPPPPSRGLVLGAEERQRFYGGLSGKQVEDELRRIAIIMQGLLHDFTIVKNSLWHIEDERGMVDARVDALEQGKINDLSEGLRRADEQIDDFGNRFELLDIRVAHLEDSNQRLNELYGRVELLDVRVSRSEVNELLSYSAPCSPPPAPVFEEDGQPRQPSPPTAPRGARASPQLGRGGRPGASSAPPPGFRPSSGLSAASEVVTEAPIDSSSLVAGDVGGVGAWAAQIAAEARLDALISAESAAVRELARVLTEDFGMQPSPPPPGAAATRGDPAGHSEWSAGRLGLVNCESPESGPEMPNPEHEPIEPLSFAPASPGFDLAAFPDDSAPAPASEGQPASPSGSDADLQVPPSTTQAATAGGLQVDLGDVHSEASSEADGQCELSPVELVPAIWPPSAGSSAKESTSSFTASSASLAPSSDGEPPDG
mmetsp:Transcript_86371/g.278938  ORF Transcript_86371/g.278938 Transcript_86371/m.278938 type:complete len:567 (+) Transcript_86371:47-1747(+)